MFKEKINFGEFGWVEMEYENYADLKAKVIKQRVEFETNVSAMKEDAPMTQEESKEIRELAKVLQKSLKRLGKMLFRSVKKR